MNRPSRERIDFSVYLRAFGVFARNPTVIVLPLLAGVIGVLVSQLSDVTGGGIIASLTTFLLLLIQLFALGVAIIIGDMGWRRGAASFDDAWQDARNKGRDILFAAFGFTFVLSIAQYAGTILPGVVGIILLAIAVYALIFTIAAAAIGGIPGSAAISVSIERVKSAPLGAALLTAVALVLMFYAGQLHRRLDLRRARRHLANGRPLTRRRRASDPHRLRRDRDGESLYRRFVHPAALVGAFLASTSLRSGTHDLCDDHFSEIGDERGGDVGAGDAFGIAERAERARDRGRIAARQPADPFGLIAR